MSDFDAALHAPSRRRSTALRVGMAAVGAAVVVLGVLLALQPSSGQQQAATPLLDHTAPSLSGPLLSGPALGQHALNGRYTVVNFFASWCSDCQQEATQLSDFVAEHAPVGDAGMVMVAFDDPATSARDFLRQTDVTWTAVNDPTGSLSLAWGVRAPPETFVVAPDGNIVAKFIGPVTAVQLDSVLAGPSRS